MGSLYYLCPKSQYLVKNQFPKLDHLPNGNSLLRIKVSRRSQRIRKFGTKKPSLGSSLGVTGRKLEKKRKKITRQIYNAKWTRNKIVLRSPVLKIRKLLSLRNIARARKTSGIDSGGVLPAPTMNDKYIPLKSESRKALDVATTSTASLGRFTDPLKDDPHKGRKRRM